MNYLENIPVDLKEIILTYINNYNDLNNFTKIIYIDEQTIKRYFLSQIKYKDIFSCNHLKEMIMPDILDHRSNILGLSENLSLNLLASSYLRSKKI